MSTVYDSEELEEIKTASLAQLGDILLDKEDSFANESIEEVDEVYITIGQEVIRRCPDPKKLESLMDFHYDKWKSASSQDERTKSYLELRAMMVGFTETRE